MKKIIFFILAFCFYKSSFSQNWSIVLDFDNGRYGVIDSLGKRILPSIYLSIDVIDDTYAVITDSLYKKGLTNNQGEILIPCKYDNIEKFFSVKTNFAIINENEFFRVHNFNKVGVYQIGKSEIIPCKYDDVSFFKFQNIFSNFFYSNTDYSLFHPQYDFFEAKVKDKWGIVDSLFNIVIPFEYQQFGTSIKEIILAKKNNKWGALSLTNKNEKIEFMYDSIFPAIIFDQLTQNYIFTVQLNDSVFILNSNGQKYYIPKSTSTDFKLVNPEFGITDGEKGMTLYYYKTHKKIETSYLNGYYYRLWDNSSIFHDNSTKKPVLLDVKGKVLYKFKKMMTDIYAGSFVIGNRYFFDGPKIFEKTDSGFNLKYILPSNKPTFLNYVIDSYPSFIILKQNKKYGVVLRTRDSLNVVLPFEYDKIDYREEYYYEESMPIIVKKNNFVGLILLENSVFKWAIPLEYESIETFDSPLYFVKKNGKYGLYVINEGLRIPCKYKSKQDVTKDF